MIHFKPIHLCSLVIFELCMHTHMGTDTVCYTAVMQQSFFISLNLDIKVNVHSLQIDSLHHQGDVAS